MRTTGKTRSNSKISFKSSKNWFEIWKEGGADNQALRNVCLGAFLCFDQHCDQQPFPKANCLIASQFSRHFKHLFLLAAAPIV
jgi:hypothetical protein